MASDDPFGTQRAIRRSRHRSRQREELDRLLFLKQQRELGKRQRAEDNRKKERLRIQDAPSLGKAAGTFEERLKADTLAFEREQFRALQEANKSTRALVTGGGSVGGGGGSVRGAGAFPAQGTQSGPAQVPTESYLAGLKQFQDNSGVLPPANFGRGGGGFRDPEARARVGYSSGIEKAIRESEKVPNKGLSTVAKDLLNRRDKTLRETPAGQSFIDSKTNPNVTFGGDSGISSGQGAFQRSGGPPLFYDANTGKTIRLDTGAEFKPPSRGSEATPKESSKARSVAHSVVTAESRKKRIAEEEKFIREDLKIPPESTEAEKIRKEIDVLMQRSPAENVAAELGTYFSNLLGTVGRASLRSASTVSDALGITDIAKLTHSTARDLQSLFEPRYLSEKQKEFNKRHGIGSR